MNFEDKNPEMRDGGAKLEPQRPVGAALRSLNPMLAQQQGRHPLESRVIIGTGVAGLLAALAAMSLAAAVDEWALGLLLGGISLLLASIAIGMQLMSKVRTPSIVDKSLLIAAMESESVGRIITDRGGNLVSANQTYRRLCFGRVPAPADLGRADAESRSVIAGIQASLDEGEKGWGVVTVVSRGRKRTLELSAKTYGLYVLWAARHADPQVLLEQSISEIKTRLRPLMDGLDLGFLVRDPDGGIVLINTTAANQLGVDPASIESLRWEDIHNDESGFCDAKSGASITIETVEYEIPGIDAGPSIGCLTLIKPPQRHAAGAGSGAGKGTGVSSVFEEAPLGVAIVRPDLSISQFNSAFDKQFGSVIGRPLSEGDKFDELVPDEDKSDVQGFVRKAAEGAAPRLPMELHLGADGDNIAQVYFSTTGEGDDARAVLYVIDTTEQKSLEIQFAQAQKMQAVGQLAGGIAHDFNNLLTAIIGFCDLLLVRHGPGDQSFSDLMQIKQNANRAANLVRQLLAFSRRQTLRPKVLVVTDVLAELSNLIRRLIGEKIELKMTHGRGLGAVKVDQGQLEQVIINLAVNARDAMEKGGRLEIATRNVGVEESAALGYKVMPGDDYVLISVTDTGTGIPEENIDKLFEPFFTTKEVGKGTGLGLSTVYGIVKQTGGFVFARNIEGGPNSHPGSGSGGFGGSGGSGGAGFEIYLPIYRAEAMPEDEVVAPGPEAAVKDLTGKETILIAEDEDAVRLFAARALSNKGYTVLDCASGEAALEALLSHDGPIDMLISDVVMPGMDGPSLVEEARKSFPALKVILISGYAEEAFRKKLDEGDYAFIPKPFSLQDLASKVREVLED